MASKLCILEHSAQSNKQKKDTLIQEEVRNLRNCAVEEEWRTKANILSEWSATMKWSRYKERYKYQMIKTVVEIYDEMIEDDRNGTRPIYKPSSEERICENVKIENKMDVRVIECGGIKVSRDVKP